MKTLVSSIGSAETIIGLVVQLVATTGGSWGYIFYVKEVLGDEAVK
jgi:hypothetical protein